MTPLYAESSAVASWLLGELPNAATARRFLAIATTIFTSELTILECDRAIRRAKQAGRLNERGADIATSKLESETDPWNVLRIGSAVMARARREFPVEPLRAMDALHLATALRIFEVQPDLHMLSFDDRVRRNAAALGLDVVPAEFPHREGRGTDE